MNFTGIRSSVSSSESTYFTFWSSFSVKVFKKSLSDRPYATIFLLMIQRYKKFQYHTTLNTHRIERPTISLYDQKQMLPIHTLQYRNRSIYRCSYNSQSSLCNFLMYGERIYNNIYIFFRTCSLKSMIPLACFLTSPTCHPKTGDTKSQNTIYQSIIILAFFE